MYKRFIKPSLDVFISLVCCPFLIPLTLFIGLAIKLDDGGSVFYLADRLGKNGKPFKMLKFRTMVMDAPDIRNADGSTYSAADDPRLTRVGRFLRETSIDELPQLINILFGQMSFIGPRPDPLEWIQKFDVYAQKKYSIRPGLSGYTQAYFRNSLTIGERVEKDLHYVENVSIGFDVKIFLVTLRKVFSRKDVYHEDT